jgi:hypothetical protein
MNDFEQRTMTALTEGEWPEDEDDWGNYLASPIDQLWVIERFREAMNPLRPAYDEL